MEAGLEAYYTYNFPYSKQVGDDLRGNLCSSYTILAGVAAVIVDREIGQITIRKLVVLLHDSGSPFTVLGAKGSGEGEQFCSQ
jgi:CO/xanthine dehydrogenase Mo-binding subunit